VTYFARPINVVFSPSFTILPPQIHHQKTTICTTFFAKTPAKPPFHTPEKNSKKNNGRAEALPSSCLNPDQLPGEKTT
jgi:hypothetical protein